MEICKQTAVGGVIAYRGMAYGLAVMENASVGLYLGRVRQIMQSLIYGHSMVLYIGEVIALLMIAYVSAVVDVASGGLHFI